MITYKEAQQIISDSVKQIIPEAEEISLFQAINRTLAEDIISDIDLPPFNNSAMDGYAVKYDQIIRDWQIKGENSAGNYRDIEINESDAVGIMTGAKLPQNCDTVIAIEDIIREGLKITLKTGVRYEKRMNIRKKGEDLGKGKIAIEKNTEIKPQHIAVLASCGLSNVSVYKKLKIGVLATGDELIDINENPAGDKIRCSNIYALTSAILEMNMEPVSFGIARDEKEEIRQKILTALNSGVDILITSGGVSVGKYDFVKEILIEVGVDIKFWKANIKPGKPIVFGIYSNENHPVLVFGLPGNPVSALVTFNLFVREILLEAYGSKRINRIFARLAQDLKKEDYKRHFVRGILSSGNNSEMIVSETGKQSSGNLVQMSRANCLIIVEEERINPKKGEMVECMII